VGSFFLLVVCPAPMTDSASATARCSNAAGLSSSYAKSVSTEQEHYAATAPHRR
jgi:hypothetical protein